jgi:hypothetical protein
MAVEISAVLKLVDEYSSTLSSLNMGLELVEKAFGALSAAASYAWAGVGKAIELANIGGAFEEQRNQYEALANSYGVNGQKIIDIVKETSQNTLSEFDSIAIATRGLAANLTGGELETALTYIKKWTEATGQSFDQVAESVFTSLSSGRFSVLRQMGLIIEKGASTADVLQAMSDNLTRFGDAGFNAGDKLGAMNASYDDLVRKIGQAINNSEAFQRVLGGLSDAFVEFVKGFDSESIRIPVDQLINGAVSVFNAIIELAPSVTEAVRGVFENPRQAAKDLGVFAIKTFYGIYETAAEVVNSVIGILETLNPGGWLTQIQGQVMRIVGSIITGVLDLVDWMFEGMVDKVTALLNTIGEFFRNSPTLSDWLGIDPEAFNFDATAQEIKSNFQTISGAFRLGFEDITNKAANFYENFDTTIKGMKFDIGSIQDKAKEALRGIEDTELKAVADQLRRTEAAKRNETNNMIAEAHKQAEALKSVEEQRKEVLKRELEQLKENKAAFKEQMDAEKEALRKREKDDKEKLDAEKEVIRAKLESVKETAQRDKEILKERQDAFKEQIAGEKEILKSRQESFKEQIEAEKEAVKERRERIKEYFDLEKEAIREKRDAFKEQIEAEKASIKERQERQKEEFQLNKESLRAEQERIKDYYADKKEALKEESSRMREQFSAEKEALKERQDSAREIFDADKQLIKDKQDALREQIDSDKALLQDQKDKAAETYSLQKEAIDKTIRDNRDLKDSLEKQAREIYEAAKEASSIQQQQLKAKIDSLSFDSSLSADQKKAAKSDIQAEIAGLKKIDDERAKAYQRELEQIKQAYAVKEEQYKAEIEAAKKVKEDEEKRIKDQLKSIEEARKAEEKRLKADLDAIAAKEKEQAKQDQAALKEIEARQKAQEKADKKNLESLEDRQKKEAGRNEQALKDIEAQRKAQEKSDKEALDSIDSKAKEQEKLDRAALKALEDRQKAIENSDKASIKNAQELKQIESEIAAILRGDKNAASISLKAIEEKEKKQKEADKKTLQAIEDKAERQEKTDKELLKRIVERQKLEEAAAKSESDRLNQRLKDLNKSIESDKDEIRQKEKEKEKEFDKEEKELKSDPGLKKVEDTVVASTKEVVKPLAEMNNEIKKVAKGIEDGNKQAKQGVQIPNQNQILQWLVNMIQNALVNNAQGSDTPIALTA